MIFFAVVSAEEPFSIVTFEHIASIDGLGYDDYVVGIASEPTPTIDASWGEVKGRFLLAD